MTNPPNIILVNCDDLGYGDLGCYGSDRNDTPHIDRLAAEGTRFTDFYMASSVCTPSRGGMLTGCYPPRIGFGWFETGRRVLCPGDPFGLHPDEETFATLLRRSGYETMLIGKWHCGDQPGFMPLDHGFDRWYGLPYSNDMGRQPGRRMANPPLPLMVDDAVVQEQPDQTGLTERYVEEAVRFLRRPRTSPFLLYFAHMYVHLPLYVPRRFTAVSRNGRYGAAVACIDWAMGVLLHELKRLSLDQNTLVLFTSDNGARYPGEGGSNAPLRDGKGNIWEGGQRLPFIARWPGRVPAGRISAGMIASIDLLPTMCELAGAELPSRTIDGVSQRELLLGGDSARDRFFYYESETLAAVREGCWKLHLGTKVSYRGIEPVCRLYNLDMDIGETTDVAVSHPEVVDRLRASCEPIRLELGDAMSGVIGAARRPPGRVEDPQPLTRYDPSCPYVYAAYDLDESG